MGFGFLSMTNRDGTPLEETVDVFVHQVRSAVGLGLEECGVDVR